MSENVTSPGPHHVGSGRFKNEREKGDEHYAIFDRNLGCVAHVFNETDAHLFGAAWELLAALERFVEEEDDGPEAWAQARAAIAKARGK